MQVTLLGQNVNSYADFSVLAGQASDSGGGDGGSGGAERRASGSQAGPSGAPPSPGPPPASGARQGDPAAAFSAYYAPGFRSVYRPSRDGALRFAQLLAGVAGVDPEMRVRFTSPHPKDFSDEVLEVSSCCGGSAAPAGGG
jgi:hypothetical protein